MLLTLFLFEKIILLMAICAGKAVNRDSINTKVFEEERVGVGEGEEKLSPESFPSPIFYSPIFAFKTSIASSMPAGFVPPA